MGWRGGLALLLPPLLAERLLKKAYVNYKGFKDSRCTDFRLLQVAIKEYDDARRLSRALPTRDDVMIIRAEIGLTECHRELSHLHRYAAPKKMEHMDEAKTFIEHALGLATQIGNKELMWRAQLESAVIRARRAIVMSKTAHPGDVEVREAVQQSKEELGRLREMPEMTQYTGFVEWADLWLAKLPNTL